MTIATSMCAIGACVHPLMVLPGTNMKAELLNGAPPSAIASCLMAGWIQKEKCTQWFKYFVRFVKPSLEDHVLLTLVGHYYHSRDI